MPPRDAAAAAGIAVVWGGELRRHPCRAERRPRRCSWRRCGSRSWRGRSPGCVPRPKLASTRLVALGLALYAGQFALLFTAMTPGCPPGWPPSSSSRRRCSPCWPPSSSLGERPGRPHLLGVGWRPWSRGAHRPRPRRCSSAVGSGLCLLAGLSWAAGNLVAAHVRRDAGARARGLGSVVAAPCSPCSPSSSRPRAAWPPRSAGIDVAGLLALGYLTGPQRRSSGSRHLVGPDGGAHSPAGPISAVHHARAVRRARHPPGSRWGATLAPAPSRAAPSSSAPAAARTPAAARATADPARVQTGSAVVDFTVFMLIRVRSDATPGSSPRRSEKKRW